MATRSRSAFPAFTLLARSSLSRAIMSSGPRATAMRSSGCASRRRVRALGWQWLKSTRSSRVILPSSAASVVRLLLRTAERWGSRHVFIEKSPGRRIPGILSGHSSNNAVTSRRGRGSISPAWNDGKIRQLGGRPKKDFLGELLNTSCPTDSPFAVSAFVRCGSPPSVPRFLPPPHSAQWDFAKAYLGASANRRRMLLEISRTRQHVVSAATVISPRRRRSGHLHSRQHRLAAIPRRRSFKTLDL